MPRPSRLELRDVVRRPAPMQASDAGSYSVKFRRDHYRDRSSDHYNAALEPERYRRFNRDSHRDCGWRRSTELSMVKEQLCHFRRDGASYSINPVQAADGGSYTVRVSNSAGSAGSILSSVATITVIVPPSITTEPSSQTVNSGSSMTLSVVALGTAPLSHQWFKNGTIISGATSLNYSISDRGGSSQRRWVRTVSGRRRQSAPLGYQ